MIELGDVAYIMVTPLTEVERLVTSLKQSLFRLEEQLKDYRQQQNTFDHVIV